MVEPRALLLAELGHALDRPNPEWLLIFEQCRRQRVNSNLIVDHGGADKFPAAEFFTQVMKQQTRKTIAAFNVFLFELEEKNVTEGNLGNYFTHEIKPKRLKLSSKKTQAFLVTYDSCVFNAL